MRERGEQRVGEGGVTSGDHDRSKPDPILLPHPTPPLYSLSPAMTTPEMMLLGRALIKETDASLARSARVVAETAAVGTKTAEALAAQTEQLERVLDDADAVREGLRRARGALVDVARGAATDR